MMQSRCWKWFILCFHVSRSLLTKSVLWHCPVQTPWPQVWKRLTVIAPSSWVTTWPTLMTSFSFPVLLAGFVPDTPTMLNVSLASHNAISVEIINFYVLLFLRTCRQKKYSGLWSFKRPWLLKHLGTPSSIKLHEVILGNIVLLLLAAPSGKPLSIAFNRCLWCDVLSLSLHRRCKSCCR